MAIWARIGVALVVAIQAAAAQAATTGLKFISTPGDYIGGGSTQTYKAPGATVTVSGSANNVHVLVAEGSHAWTLDFAAPQGQALAIGSYANAARWPFQSPLGAGLAVSGDGRGCNTLEGWFRVLELEIDASNTVRKLAIDFEQNCEVTMPPLYGAVRVNSSKGLTVPDLVAVAGADFASFAGQTVTLDGSQSFSRSRPRALAYRWSQVAGPAVTLSSSTVASPSFTAPAVPPAGEALQFRLQVSDGSRQSASDDVVVLVQSPATPRTEFSFRGDPGDYISLGRSWRYDTGNATIGVSRNFDNGVSVAISGATWWSFDTAAPGNAPLAVGTYGGATRFPFQAATEPGLNLSGDGRGCNTLSGSFTVHQAQFDAGGTPQVLDIDFEQHCEGGVPAAYGRFLLNAVPAAQLAPQLRAARQRLGVRP